jgi:hypothetical protein
LIAQALTGQDPDLDLAPFRPDRFPASPPASVSHPSPRPSSDAEEAS